VEADHADGVREFTSSPNTRRRFFYDDFHTERETA